jgi:16S rRNA (uracil1498-N3)-methyltransferase
MMRVVVQPGGCPQGGWAAGQRVSLGEDEAQHLRVRRAKDGQVVEVLDGAGLRGSGSLVRSGRTWSVDIRDALREPPPAELTLAVAAGDRERFSWMIEKAVELGVTAVVPLETSRTAGVATGLKPAHVERLRRRALEATKQCGASWVLRVESPVTLRSFLEQPRSGTKWLADAAAESPPFKLDQGAVTVIVGPEGGLTDEERESLISSGYRPVALGPQTLRFETAALAAAALVSVARMRESHG